MAAADALVPPSPRPGFFGLSGEFTALAIGLFAGILPLLEPGSDSLGRCSLCLFSPHSLACVLEAKAVAFVVLCSRHFASSAAVSLGRLGRASIRSDCRRGVVGGHGATDGVAD